MCNNVLKSTTIAITLVLDFVLPMLVMLAKIKSNWIGVRKQYKKPLPSIQSVGLAARQGSVNVLECNILIRQISLIKAEVKEWLATGAVKGATESRACEARKGAQSGISPALERSERLAGLCPLTAVVSLKS